MTIGEIASELCKLEGKKSQIKRGDMMEAVKRLYVWNAQCVIDHKKSPIRSIWKMSQSEVQKIKKAKRKSKGRK